MRHLPFLKSIYIPNFRKRATPRPTGVPVIYPSKPINVAGNIKSNRFAPLAILAAVELPPIHALLRYAHFEIDD
jgi:hypothetical protein